MTKKRRERDDVIPAGVCTALHCACAMFRPKESGPMYCLDCGHSVEHHHLDARDVAL